MSDILPYNGGPVGTRRISCSESVESSLIRFLCYAPRIRYQISYPRQIQGLRQFTPWGPAMVVKNTGLMLCTINFLPSLLIGQALMAFDSRTRSRDEFV